MITLDIKIQGLNELSRGMFKDVDTAILRTLNAGGRDFVIAVKADTPKGVSGALRAGVYYRVIGQFLARTLIIDVRGSAKQYAQYREDGRKPGRQPPPNKIMEWLRLTPKGRRFVAAIKSAYKIKDDETALKSATFLKGRAIGKRGYKGAKMFEKNFKRAKPKIEAALRNNIIAALKNYQ